MQIKAPNTANHYFAIEKAIDKHIFMEKCGRKRLHAETLEEFFVINGLIGCQRQDGDNLLASFRESFMRDTNKEDCKR